MADLYRIQPGAFEAMAYSRPPRNFDGMICEVEFMPEDPALPVLVKTEEGNIETVPFAFLSSCGLYDARHSPGEWRAGICRICGSGIVVNYEDEKMYDCCDRPSCVSEMTRSLCG